MHLVKLENDIRNIHVPNFRSTHSERARERESERARERERGRERVVWHVACGMWHVTLLAGCPLLDMIDPFLGVLPKHQLVLAGTDVDAETETGVETDRHGR